MLAACSFTVCHRGPSPDLQLRRAHAAGEALDALRASHCLAVALSSDNVSCRAFICAAGLGHVHLPCTVEPYFYRGVSHSNKATETKRGRGALTLLPFCHGRCCQSGVLPSKLIPPTLCYLCCRGGRLRTGGTVISELPSGRRKPLQLLGLHHLPQPTVLHLKPTSKAACQGCHRWGATRQGSIRRDLSAHRL